MPLVVLAVRREGLLLEGLALLRQRVLLDFIDMNRAFFGCILRGLRALVSLI